MIGVMPQLAHSKRGYRHTIDSALETLRSIGVGYNRITISKAGRGWPDRTIVAQEPMPGASLGPDTSVHLRVAGTGVFHGLPVGMWDRGHDIQPGTAELVGLLDDPVEHAGHWVRAGARLFDIGPSNLEACSRWIALFGLSVDDWPAETWYHLAVLLPNLHRISGKHAGVALALGMILNLPLLEIRRERNCVALPAGQQSRLAARHGRLGVDLVLSDHRESLARWTVCIGPVPLRTFYQYEDSAERRRVDLLLGLTLPLYQEYKVAWTVLDPNAPIRLGSAEANGILGINSYFGPGLTAETITGAVNG